MLTPHRRNVSAIAKEIDVRVHIESTRTLEVQVELPEVLDGVEASDLVEVREELVWVRAVLPELCVVPEGPRSLQRV